MAKEKKGFFSWLGFGRNKEENIEQEKEQQRLEEERLEQERLAKEAKEDAARQAQLEAEQERLEAERQEAQRVIQDRLAQEAEKQRLEQEKAQRQAEIEAEQARLEAEHAEQARLAQEAQAQRLAQEEAQRQAEVKAEQERLEAQRQEAERAEQDRLAQEAEAQRLAQEEAQRQEAERAEQARLAQEAQAQRLAQEEAQRQAELKAEQERLEAQRQEAERAEQARLAQEAEAQRLAQEEAQRQAELKAEQERLEAQRQEAERAEQARLAQEAEAQRLAQEEAQRQAELKAEQERLEAQRQEAERAEQDRLAQEAEAQRLAQEENERLAIAQAEAEDIESLREEVLADKVVEQEKPKKEGFFSRLKKGLLKTRQNLGSGFLGLFRGKKIDDELFEELEEQLLIADVGMETTTKIITSLTKHATHKDLKDAEALYGKLREEMSDILSKVDKPLNIEGKKPFVILMVGVNGVGKTTTIGKLARQYQAEGKSVMLAAGDTFRAAAVEQLQVWGERNNIPVVAQHTGADPASVIFDAIQSAQAKGVDVLIADTAGRLQNKSHLMEELKKIVRVMKKLDEEAPHEVMLTLDASTGQNAVSQAKLFNETVGLTGLTLTKLDGTAKGGVIFSIADQFSIPIRYIGVGEGIEDLRPFKADDFIEALFAREE
ncbi:signal recognition particle-docking protein FtsY [Proteus terrae]|uniref:signal recognition particle-docking protein FtsY n=1 Tax=Proteus terrae TaxID=1574161 RepID=UPI00132FBBDC|nr:signal recognition particle-docking protein FtsY [Proteus terrae]QKD70717.1 signal recognition particle-docking protein FtsY [Proteus terrae subsp. cibarius]QKD72544.1 signal recognition particle-docking protein FtsY [Proteus terrae subsp. cibarius]UDF26377.1 signal recognition particle-docking protein FtsY [Proteus terrae subsp. cibarius]WCG87318.1 signal recognition particle-docking protein FtsY [Proteus terrae]